MPFLHRNGQVSNSTCQVPEVSKFDEEVAAGKIVTFAELCRLTSLSILYHFGQQDVSWQELAWQLAVVAGALDTLQQLVKLSVDFNSSSITDEGCQALGGEVSKLAQLTTLELNLRGGNKVSDGGCRALADGLSKLLKLATLSLDFGFHSVGDGGCQALGDFFCAHAVHARSSDGHQSSI